MKLNRSRIALCAMLGAAALSLFSAEEGQKPYGGKGVLVFVNTCGVPVERINVAANTLRNMLMIHTRVKNGSWSLATARQ
ncbi:MAG: hypothetical protein IKJ89_00860, partial [Kiritimatiellae bacterium]|nr:hypothetical protein [Kiritimatiellia bacterium]